MTGLAIPTQIETCNIDIICPIYPCSRVSRGGGREGRIKGGRRRRRIFSVENRVGLGVAAFTRGILELDDVGAGVEDHVDVFGGRADADAGEVLAVALGEAGDDGGAEPGGGWAGSGHCGNIQISSPFRLQGDPGHCGNKSYELSCEADGTNQSHHAILYLFSGKYYVEAINYNNYTIRLVDAGVHNTKDNYFSNPVYPLTVFNFSSYSFSKYQPYSLSYPYFESPDVSFPADQYLTAPLVMLSCKNPMNYSDLFVETAPCINNTSIHSSSDPSLSTVYSYFMHGRFNKYNEPDIRTADLGLSCKITLMVLVSPPPTPTDEYIKSCQGIYKQLAYGFQLTWIDYQCRKNCGQNYDEWPLKCGLITYNTSGGRADADAGEVLAVALGEAGDDGGAEPGGGWAGSGAVVGEGGEGVEAEGVVAEAEVEELGGGLVEGEGVEVVEREGEGRWVGVRFGVVEREGEGR
ncbi:hypothetical protein ACLB2K_004228 [Fragaria x ananassa]